MSVTATPHEGPTAGEPAPSFQQKLGPFDATMLVAGTMIGSGIFIVSAEIARDVGSSGWLLAIWVLTGVMTIMGALCYAELAAMMPHAGGQYVYLREAYSPLWGFLYGWTLFMVIQTGSIAAVAVAFAKFLGVLVPALGTGPDGVIYKFTDLNIKVPLPLPWLEKPLIVFERTEFTVTRGQLVAVAVVAFLTLLNCRGVREGKWVQNLFTVAKTLALIMLIIVGLTVAANQMAITSNLDNVWRGAAEGSRFKEVNSLVRGPVWLVVLMIAGGAMVGSLFSADAWNNVTFTAGEVRDPRRTLPISLVVGAGSVILLYLLANVAYLSSLAVRGESNFRARIASLDQKIGLLEETNPDQAKELQKERENLLENATTEERGIAFARDDRVATAVLDLVSPRLGAGLMAVAIMISTFGCVNGMILMGARLYYAMAQDGLFFSSVGRLTSSGVPAAGLLLQGAWSILLIFSGTYSELLDYVIFAALLFYVLTVVGLFVLRRKRPDAERPYRVWGYPLLPAIYVTLCALVMVNLLIVKPVYTWPGLILVLTGIPVYFWWRLVRFGTLDAKEMTP
jgi:APA family basic amino acid/polyamine antiporter